MSSTWPSRRSILHYWNTNTNLLEQNCRRAAIQLSFETGEFRRMYDKVHNWPKQMQDSAVEILSQWAYQGHSKQMKRWVEHYLELYFKESSILNDMHCRSSISLGGTGHNADCWEAEQSHWQVTHKKDIKTGWHSTRGHQMHKGCWPYGESTVSMLSGRNGVARYKRLLYSHTL